ncbi:MAG: hypothetical protein AAGE52_35890 [Myxococcota bacterium]
MQHGDPETPLRRATRLRRGSLFLYARRDVPESLGGAGMLAGVPSPSPFQVRHARRYVLQSNITQHLPRLAGLVFELVCDRPKRLRA